MLLAVRWLDTLLGTPPPGDETVRLNARLTAVETHIKALYDHSAETARELQQLRRDEARRAAEHATMVDALDRLYKRVSARIARQDDKAEEESTYDLRKRLGR